MKAQILVVMFVTVFAEQCTREPPDTPEATLTTWVSAMGASDVGARRRAYDLLAQSAQASLAVRAARASQLSGREIRAWEMLAPGRFVLPPRFEPFEADSLSSSVHGDRAAVSVRGRTGESVTVPMVRENGSWRVDLVLPSMEAIQAGSDAGR